jgi:hypothetical protein
MLRIRKVDAKYQVTVDVTADYDPEDANDVESLGHAIKAIEADLCDKLDLICLTIEKGDFDEVVIDKKGGMQCRNKPPEAETPDQD